MFSGEFSCKVDAKGRLILPFKIREQLNSNIIIVAKGTSRNIEIYVEEEWNRKIEKISNLVGPAESIRKYKHFLVSSAHKIEIDSQGRLNLPAPLIDYASINKEVSIVGNIETVQIWDKDTWRAYIENVTVDIQDIMEELNV